jgi:D-alanyl-D-alanine dipeptidase
MRTLVVVVLLAGAARAQSVKDALAHHPGLVDAATIGKELQVELKYATRDNFLGRSVYGDLAACWLQRDAADMLARAQDALVRAHPDLRLHVYDCARPSWVQRAMWAIVKDTPRRPYVADPAKGSIHNFGCAVDLTVAARDGTPVDMGTPFDTFGDLARPDREIDALEEGKLTGAQVANRLVLREAMLRAGFRMLANEWWHFDCASHADTRKKYKIIP